MLDSLNAGMGDTVRTNCGTSQYMYVCYDTASYSIFGLSRRSKAFSEMQFETGYGRKFCQNIGLVESGYSSILCNQSSVLIGCVINGIMYGDTSLLTGINQISSEVPEQFSLSQNYPNPFNPTTHFEFRIADFGLVRIIVYNAVGEEIETLVNHNLSPGTYQADFDGTNFPSGVYYYRLEVFDPSTPLRAAFTQTKKMMFIK
jgi:hypothetical protein